MTLSVKKRKRTFRRDRGVSMAELLVGSILLGVSLAAVGELMSLCVFANTTLFRQFDAQVGADFAMDRIKRDVRVATRVCSALTLEEATEFGRTSSLSSQVLILRQPIHYVSKLNDTASGVYDSSAVTDFQTGFEIPGYYLVVYEVSADPERSGEYLITMSRRRFPRDDEYKTRYPLAGESASFLANIERQTVAKGIVGPLDDSGDSVPKVFSFVSKNPGTGRLDLVKETYLFDDGISRGVNGVAIDMEVLRSGTPGGNESTDRNIAAHTEVFMRQSDSAMGIVNPEAFE